MVSAMMLLQQCYGNKSQFSLTNWTMTRCHIMVYTGKISASSGHASWISSKKSRTRVFEMRGRSDAVIVGGNTVRRDSTTLPSPI